MALKFKLVMRKNLGEDHESIPEKVYAQMVYGDLVTFDEFAEEVADSSGVGSASVKAVLDRMNVVLVSHLQHELAPPTEKECKEEEKNTDNVEVVANADIRNKHQHFSKVKI